VGNCFLGIFETAGSFPQEKPIISAGNVWSEWERFPCSSIFPTNVPHEIPQQISQVMLQESYFRR